MTDDPQDLGKILGLNGKPVVPQPAQPVPEIVTMLEQALNEARSGELRSAGLVKVFGNGSDGSVSVAWWITGTNNHIIVAGISYLWHRVLTMADSQWQK